MSLRFGGPWGAAGGVRSPSHPTRQPAAPGVPLAQAGRGSGWGLADCVTVWTYPSLCLSFSAVPGGVNRPGGSKAQLGRKPGYFGGGEGWKSSPQALHPLCPDKLSRGHLRVPAVPAGHPEAWTGQGAGWCPQGRRCAQFRKREVDTPPPGVGRDAGAREAPPQGLVAFPGLQAPGWTVRWALGAGPSASPVKTPPLNRRGS